MSKALRRLPLAVAFVAAAVPLIVVPASSGSAKRAFHDTVGEVDCCTRDLTDVVVRNDDAGRITFEIHFDGRAEGDDDDDLYLLLDKDRNSATGGFGEGFELMIGTHVGSWGADDATLNDLPTKRILVTVAGKLIRITLDRHLIGDTDGFRFRIEAWEVAQGSAYVDKAPDRGAWSFPIRIATRRLRPKLTTSGHARAGHQFVGRLSLRVAGTRRRLGSGRVLCHASVAGRRLEPLVAAFAGRRAACAWRLPNDSRGRTIHGSVGVAITSRAQVARRFAAVIG